MTRALSALTNSTLLRSLAIGVLVALGLLLLTDHVSEYRNTQVATAAYSFCAIAGLTVLTGLSGQISLGNGAFMFVGAYTVELLLVHHPTTDNKLLMVWLLAAVVAAAIVGGFVGVAAARLRGPYLAGITLALALGLPALPKYQHLSSLGGHSGLSALSPAAPGTIDLYKWQAWICCLGAVITLVLLANLVGSRIGRGFKAVRDDEIAASLAGLSVARVQISAFVVSAACAGLGGGLLAVVQGSAGPDSFPLSLSLDLLAAAVFGGLGSLAGAAYGAVLITFLQPWSTDVANNLSLPSKVALNLPYAAYGVILIAAMLALPFGLQGLLRRLWDPLIARVRGARATVG